MDRRTMLASSLGGVAAMATGNLSAGETRGDTRKVFKTVLMNESRWDLESLAFDCFKAMLARTAWATPADAFEAAEAFIAEQVRRSVEN